MRPVWRQRLPQQQHRAHAIIHVIIHGKSAHRIGDTCDNTYIGRIIVRALFGGYAFHENVNMLIQKHNAM